MNLLLKLLLAHIVGDFLVQPTSWVEDKESKKIKSPKLYLHVAVHALLILILLGSHPALWPILTISVLLHYLIDLAKLYTQNAKNRRAFFFIDQVLHLIVVSFLVYMYDPLEVSLGLTQNQILLFLVMLLLNTFVSAIVIKLAMSRWTPETDDKDDESLSKAGYYIGILERLFVFSFIITNHWEAVGFLLAAKSVFRFGDLKESKDRKLTEYILIGTLLSFGMAMACGIFYLKIAPQL